MSNDLSAIHAQTSAILEKLYEERGQPNELNKDFIKEFFELVKDDLNLDDEEDEVALFNTEARLSQQEKGLIDVILPYKNEKFVVSEAKAVKHLLGTSQGIGRGHRKGTYVMTLVKNCIPNIMIKTGSGVVIFLGTPNKVQSERGEGEWKRA